MTPLEAMAAALEPHVWSNDPDMERFCLRALRTLKASGFELTRLADSEELTRVFGHDVRADALAHLKAKAQEMREGEA